MKGSTVPFDARSDASPPWSAPPIRVNVPPMNTRVAVVAIVFTKPKLLAGGAHEATASPVVMSTSATSVRAAPPMEVKSPPTYTVVAVGPGCNA